MLLCGTVPAALPSAGLKACTVAALAGASITLSAASFAQSDGVPARVEAVLFAGCREVLSGPVCVCTADTRLTFWVESANASAVVVEVDHARVSPKLIEVANGFRFVLDEVGTAREITVRSYDAHSLLILPLVSVEEDHELELAESLRKDEKTLREARTHAERAIASPTPLIRARAKSMLARILMRSGDYRGASRWFEDAVRSHREVGCISAQYRDLTALAFMAIYRQRDFSHAADALHRAEQLVADDAEQRAILPYYQFQLALETGRLGSAVSMLELAEAGAEKLALSQQLNDVRMARLDLLIVLGRGGEARTLIRKLAATDLEAQPACKRAEVMNNLAWYSLLMRDAGVEADDAIAPASLASASEALYRAGAECDDSLLDSIALATQALAQFQHHDLDAASSTLDQAELRAPAVDALNGTERLELKARIARARTQYSDALDTYSKLETLSRDAQLPIVEWRALVGAAQTLTATKRDREALAKYDAADELFRELLALVPLGDGRDDFALRAEHASAEHVALLVRMGDADRALAVARRDRVRALGLLDIASRVDRMSKSEEASWIAARNEYRTARDALDEILAEEQELREARLKMPADELKGFLAQHANLAERGAAARRALKRAFERALAAVGSETPLPGRSDRSKLGPNDLLLVYHPLPDGWVAFARTAKKTRMEILPKKGDAISLLAPFRAELDRAKRVVVMPSGELEDVNFHTIPVDGTPLGLRVKLSYGIDVEAKPAQPAPKNGGLALVVAVDPTGTLKSIEGEARAVSEILSAQGREVVSLFGVKATRAELSKWLADPRVTSFHFAGHAVSGGRDGLESRLLLSDGSLTGTDLLAIGHAPREVVISACEAGKASAQGGVLGLGLAQAFILAGAKKVLASSAPAEDTRTFEMMKAVYASGSALDAGAVAKAAYDAKGTDSFRVVEAW